MDIKCVHENQLFNGKNFHIFIYHKTESITGLHQHDYYEFTLVLTGRYYQEINDKRVLLKRGDFAFVPVGSSHQSFYDFGSTRILNVGISKAFFDKYYLHLLPSYFVESQAYHIKDSFLNYIESMTGSLHFSKSEFSEFVEMVTFHIINRIRHYREVESQEDIPLWLRQTVDEMHNKEMFGENALLNMVTLAGKTKEYLTRTTQCYYGQTPMQMINAIRIDFAKRQLEITNSSVTDIAYEVGYSSPSLFIKNFKKLTSFTPKHYRKRLSNIDYANDGLI